MSTDVFAFGNSHLSCLETSYQSQGAPNGVTISFLNLNAEKDALARAATDKIGLAAFVLERVRSSFSDMVLGRTLWVSRLGGNEHNVLGLMEHPRSFDFILPEQPALPMIAGAEHVPYDYVARTLGKRVRGSLFHLKRIKVETGARVVHLSAPPPIGDDSFVVAHLDSYFIGQNKDMRVAQRGLRWKLWKLQTNLAKALCNEMEVEFWDVPPESLDGEGFLIPEYFSHDATHTNAAYGQKMIEAIAEQVERPIKTGSSQ